MVKYLQYKNNNRRGTENKKVNKKYLSGCGSYISVKGAVKHERTEKHLKAIDVEPPIENIDIFHGHPIIFLKARPALTISKSR